MSSETGIEHEPNYTRAERRVLAGTEFLCLVLTYALAACVLTYVLFLEK